MKVSEVGEFKLIGLIADLVNQNQRPEAASRNLIIGIGDDTAAWKTKEGIGLATTDTLVQDIHFDLKLTGWRELGWKAMAANLSDIAAMGGMPEYSLVSLSLPGDLEVENITELYQGMMALARRHGVAIAGGNITGSPISVIALALYGSLPQGISPLTRYSAQPGDVIAVTGQLGSAAAGLKILREKLALPKAVATMLREAYLKPVPRVEEGRKILELGVKCAIDISDGLLGDLEHICRSSRVGARLDVELIPVPPSLRDVFKDSWMDLALGGGEEYELLFTATRETIKKVTRHLTCPVTVIGEIVAAPYPEIVVTGKSGKTLPLSRRGWEHFKSSPSL